MATSLKRSWMRALLTSCIVLIAGLSAAQAASAATITTTGWHTVCAESLTNYLQLGGTVTLHEGHIFQVYAFSDGGNIVWGWNLGDRYGWVYNGWFC